MARHVTRFESDIPKDSGRTSEVGVFKRIQALSISSLIVETGGSTASGDDIVNSLIGFLRARTQCIVAPCVGLSDCLARRRVK